MWANPARPTEPVLRGLTPGPGCSRRVFALSSGRCRPPPTVPASPVLGAAVGTCRPPLDMQVSTHRSCSESRLSLQNPRGDLELWRPLSPTLPRACLVPAGGAEVALSFVGFYCILFS